jgi:histidinol-phosphatase
MNEDREKFGEIERRYIAAQNIALKAGCIAQKYFLKKGKKIEEKSDKSFVTEADKHVENFLYEQINDKFLDDSLLGEENGAVAGKNSFRWIVDPIDGTFSFIRGMPFYATLIGLECAGELVAGVMRFPALEETYYGGPGFGSFCDNRYANKQAIKVSSTSAISDSVFASTSKDYFRKSSQERLYDAISVASAVTCGYPDAYAFALLAAGRVDFVVEPQVHPWDIAAIKPIIEAAGGNLTDFKGRSTIFGFECVASNGLLHPEILQFTVHG